MVAVALVWARVPPNATNCAVISQPIILSSFHHDHIITHHTARLQPGSKRQLLRNVQKVWFNSTKEIFERRWDSNSAVYTVCAVCFLIFWNGFQSVESKTGTPLMYWADGLRTAGSMAGPFYHISSHDNNTISLVKWKLRDGIRERRK